VTPSLVQTHKDLAVLARHVHLPVQSGSDRVLKRMIRRYNREEFVARAAALRGAAADLTLTTDIIVGFPGETDEDFEATLSLVREVAFTGLFGFKYSQRPHTPARRLPDDVPEAVKSERLARLFEVSEELGGAHLTRLVGTRARVLVEGRDKGSGALWSGRSERNEIVHIADAGDKDLAGMLVEVEIARANRHSLEGRLSEEARLAASSRPLASKAPRGGRRSLPVLTPEG
jgi:tRNA-2-methylthio-N6-dimethylallyladenosine synthase